jgi:hypothetical protein
MSRTQHQPVVSKYATKRQLQVLRGRVADVLNMDERTLDAMFRDHIRGRSVQTQHGTNLVEIDWLKALLAGAQRKDAKAPERERMRA